MGEYGAWDPTGDRTNELPWGCADVSGLPLYAIAQTRKHSAPGRAADSVKGQWLFCAHFHPVLPRHGAKAGRFGHGTEREEAGTARDGASRLRRRDRRAGAQRAVPQGPEGGPAGLPRKRPGRSPGAAERPGAGARLPVPGRGGALRHLQLRRAARRLFERTESAQESGRTVPHGHGHGGGLSETDGQRGKEHPDGAAAAGSPHPHRPAVALRRGRDRQRDDHQLHRHHRRPDRASGHGQPGQAGGRARQHLHYLCGR